MDYILEIMCILVLLGYGIYITIRYERLKDTTFELVDNLLDAVIEKQDEIETMRRLP